MFFIIEDTDIASYADDNTPYFSADNMDGDEEEASEILFIWFINNLRKSNADKISFVSLYKQYCQKKKKKIENFDITDSNSDKLLGVKFEHKLFFNDHISELCRKSRRKNHALTIVTLYMSISTGPFLRDAFFKRLFSYMDVPLYR